MASSDSMPSENYDYFSDEDPSKPTYEGNPEEFEKKAIWFILHSSYGINELATDFQKYYEIGKEELEVILCAVSDRRLVLDTKLWFEVINHSGGLKSEMSKVLDFCGVYSIDKITPQTLISGKAYKNEETGELVPVKGLLSQIDGKVLLIKDGSMLLTTHPDKRLEVFGQLRALADGYLEAGYGNFSEKIRVEGDIGLILFATPYIDDFTVMQSLLGERFLRLRMDFKVKPILGKIRLNFDREKDIRAELGILTHVFLQRKVKFDKKPVVSDYWLNRIEDLAIYIGKMRTQVKCEWFRGQIVAITSEPIEEIPSRLFKQLIKLGMLLTLIRGKTDFGQEEYDTLIRIGEDTIAPYVRSKILKQYLKNDYKYTDQRSISESIKVSQNCVSVHLTMMEGCRLIKENFELTDETRTLMLRVYDLKRFEEEQKLQPQIIKKESEGDLA